MKIAMLSGAYVNAGDFLIEDRARLLLERLLGADVSIYKRNRLLDTEIEEINAHDALVFAGGPIYQKGIYPTAIPFVTELNRIHIPTWILGGGWKERFEKQKRANAQQKYFYPATESFFKFVCEHGNGVPLGCRDWYTVERLKKAGFSGLTMTGCPAWYDLEQIEGLAAADYEKKWKGMEKICVSDAAFPENEMKMRQLVVFLREHFGETPILFLFHRGIERKKAFLSFLDHYHVNYKDISGSPDGFELYNDCGMHIGFRVHAHIYNLSRGNISILLNEDLRGAGVNDALGIRNIDLAFNIMRRNTEDRHLTEQLDFYFEYLKQTDFWQYRNAGRNIQFYYERMKNHIESFRNAINRGS